MQATDCAARKSKPRSHRRVRLGEREVGGLCAMLVAGGGVSVALYCFPAGGGYLSAAVALCVLALCAWPCFALLRRAGSGSLCAALRMCWGGGVARAFSLGMGAMLPCVGGVALAQLLSLAAHATESGEGGVCKAVLLAALAGVALCGVIAQGRLAGLLRYVLLLLAALMLCAGACNWSADRLFPLLCEGGELLAWNGLRESVAFLGLLGLLLCGEAARDGDALRRGCRRGALVGGIACVLCMLAVALYISPATQSLVRHPLYGLTATMDSGQFFQRPASLFLWVLLPTPLIAAAFLSTAGGKLLAFGAGRGDHPAWTPVGLAITFAVALSLRYGQAGATQTLLAILDWAWLLPLSLAAACALGCRRLARRGAS